MAQTVVALDVASSKEIRVSVFEASFRRIELHESFAVFVQDNEEISAFWQRLRAMLPQHIEAVVAGIDARGTSSRLLDFPFGDLKRLPQAVQYELENQVPYDLQQAAIAWEPVSRQSKKSRILAMVSPKALLQQLLEVLTTVQLEPRSILHPSIGLFSLLPEAVGLKANTVQAIFSFDHIDSHLAVGVSGRVHYVRTLKMGGDHIERVIAKNLQIDLQQARVLLQEKAKIVSAEQAAEDPLALALNEGLLGVFGALSTTLRALPIELLPSQLWLVGELSILPGLVEHLKQRLGIEVYVLDLMDALHQQKIDLPSKTRIASKQAISIGLALTQLRQINLCPFNFRRGDMVYRGDVKAYKGYMGRLLFAGAVTLCLALMSYIVDFSLLKIEEKELNQAFCSTTLRMLGRSICNPTAAIANLKQSPGASSGVTIPSYSAVAILEMLSQLLPSDFDVVLDEVDIAVDGLADQPEQLIAKGEVATFDAIDQLLGYLKEGSCIQESNISRQNKVANGRVEFTLQLKISCPQGQVPGEALLANRTESGGVP